MKTIRVIALALLVSTALSSCHDENNSAQNQGASTPIDSSNVKGAAPATYGGNNPANDERDTNKTNINDTGTKANNVHNTGTYK